MKKKKESFINYSVSWDKRRVVYYYSKFVITRPTLFLSRHSRVNHIIFYSVFLQTFYSPSDDDEECCVLFSRLTGMNNRDYAKKNEGNALRRTKMLLMEIRNFERKEWTQKGIQCLKISFPSSRHCWLKIQSPVSIQALHSSILFPSKTGKRLWKVFPILHTKTSAMRYKKKWNLKKSLRV